MGRFASYAEQKILGLDRGLDVEIGKKSRMNPRLLVQSVEEAAELFISIYIESPRDKTGGK